MRLPHPILLALASAAAATPLSEWVSLCVRSQSGQIESLVSCGDASSFTDCVNELSERIERADLEACLATAGCSEELAAVGADTLIYACEGVQQSSGDLRKRQRGGSKAGDDADSDSSNSDSSDSDSSDSDSSDSDTEDDSTTDSKSDDKDDTTNDSKTDNKDKPAEEDKEKEEPAKTAEKTDKPATKTEETKVTETPDKATTSSSKNARPTDSECYDTETTQSDLCTMKDDRNSCKPIDVEKKVCREGYVCVVEDKGGVSCMERIDKLDIGGIIVSIAFGSAIVVAIGLMTFFCCKDRRDQKNLVAKAEATAIAKASNVGKKARNVSDRQPLMAGPGPSSPGGSPYGGEQPNPFNDQSRY